MVIKYDSVNKPGISNLMNIYAALTGTSMSDIESKFANSNYGEFKKEVADVVVDLVSGIQEKYNKLVNSPELDEILNKGREFMLPLAKEKFEIMKRKIGLAR